MSTQLELYTNNLIKQYDEIDRKICVLLQSEIEKICDKWELKFFAGMGCYGILFAEDTEIVECLEYDGSEYSRSLSTDSINDYMDILESSELSELCDDWNKIESIARKLASETEKQYEEWYLTGVSDYNGSFTYKHGYPNPNPRKKKYYTFEALSEINVFN